MAVDHVFLMQCVVTVCIIGIGIGLIFFPSYDGSFTTGVAMVSSMAGYWLPNPNRKQKNISNSGNSSGIETDPDSGNSDSNSNNTTTDTRNSLDVSNLTSNQASRRRPRNAQNYTNDIDDKGNDTNDIDDKGNDTNDDSHSVHINIGDSNGSKPKPKSKRMKGVSRSVMVSHHYGADDIGDGDNDKDNDSHSVHINTGDDNDPKPKPKSKRVKGVSRSVMVSHHYDADDIDDNGNDKDNDSHSVHINIGDNNDPKPKHERMKGVSKSIMKTVSKIESEVVPYIHVDGQSPHQNKRNHDIPSIENNDDSDSVNDAHIAV